MHVIARGRRELLWITAGGVVAGGALALAIGRIVGNRVASVDAFDPVVTAGAILTVAVVSVLAGVVPARRAARLDPIRALRHE